ncbi:MAG: penicillin-binding protein 2 [Verrucomicrobiales bacterium]|nr:penicillin-binding protein 2 [Verrucomicrobiales bacterium]
MIVNLKRRLTVACVALVMLLSVLSGRLIYIELFRAEDLSSLARNRYEYKEVLPGQRGRIYDSSGELLARNQTVYSLVVDCFHLKDQGFACAGVATKEGLRTHEVRKKYHPDEILARYREHVAESLSKPLRMPVQELGRMLREKTVGEIVLAKGIEDDFSRQLTEVIREKSLRGLYLRKAERRYYPSPLSLTQVIGYVDQDGVGVSGVEKTLNEVLTGKPGYRFCERDRKSREIHAYRGQQVDPMSGKDVYLTINMALQEVVEREMDAVIDRHRPEKATAIFLNPKTGQVLAMSNRPHYDLSTREGIRGMMPVRRNIAVTDLYQPGSTFKVVGYGAAFDRGLATPVTEVDCEMGAYDLDGFVLKDHHPYGILTAQVAFAKSSNIGAYKVARPLNREGFHAYAQKFGFGSKTGIELNAEQAGWMSGVDSWSKPSFSSRAMGYEVSVTPMQMAMACSVIANDGVYQPPTIIESIREGATHDVQILKGDMKAARRVLSAKAAAQVRQCMMETLTEIGTGPKAKLPGYSMGGKTGTARKYIENVGYVSGRYTASFMGFLPADDPQLVGLVIVDDPSITNGPAYGGSVAGPVFKAIVADAVKILGIEPDLPEEIEAEPETSLANFSGLEREG